MSVTDFSPTALAIAHRAVHRAVIPIGLALPPETPLEEAIARMCEAHTSYVVIAQQQRPLGLFTEHDLMRLVAAGQPTTGVTLSAVMAPAVNTVTTTDLNDTFGLEGVEPLMRARQASHLIVTDDAGQLTGIITQSSLAKALSLAAADDRATGDRIKAFQQEHTKDELQLNSLTEAYEELTLMFNEQQVAEQQLVETNERLTQARQQIEQQQQHYQDLFNLAPDGYLITDISGHIQEANQAAARLLCPQQPPNYLAGLPLRIFVCEQQQMFLRNCLYQLKSPSHPTLFELKLTPSQQTKTVPVAVTISAITNKQDQLVGIRWLLRDVTELKLAEQALQQVNTDLETRVQNRTAELRQAEHQWRSLLENVQLAVVGLDCDGIVTYANPYLLRLLKYPESEVVGQNWFERFIPAEQSLPAPFPQAQTFQQQLAQSGMPAQNQNGLLTRCDGMRVIDWNNTLLKNFAGKTIGVMSIGSDITERAAIERMKGEFIAIVSHELRTPLTAIHGGIKLLSGGLVSGDSARGQRLLQVVADSSQRLVRLINDILELERLESGSSVLKKAAVNTQVLTAQVSASLQLEADAAGVVIEVSDPGFELMVDSDRIIQVLTNLLDNAIKFSPAGATVWLFVDRARSDSQQAFIRFQVRDQGRGIPPEKCAAIFERFVQVDSSDSREKGGTGLGLSICQNIVTQHGGTLSVESTPGEGTCFSFTLPDELPNEAHTNKVTRDDR